jgi:hypothetical protein
MITPERFVFVGLILGGILNGSVRNGVWAPTNATLAAGKGSEASAGGNVHAWTNAVAEVLRRLNIVFGFFID